METKSKIMIVAGAYVVFSRLDDTILTILFRLALELKGRIIHN
jgi:hypothetical protein